jgi:hypothetical protein
MALTTGRTHCTVKANFVHWLELACSDDFWQQIKEGTFPDSMKDVIYPVRKAERRVCLARRLIGRLFWQRS